MSFTFTGMPSLISMVRQVNNLKVPLRTGLRRSGQAWIKHIKQSMRDTPTGKDGHSLPGQYPASVSGRLQASFSTTFSGWSTVEVGTNIDYAKYLQDGTSRMLPRPIFGRDYEEDRLRQEFENIVRVELEKWMNK